MDDDFDEDNYDPEEEALDTGHNEDDDEDQIEQMFDARNQDVWSSAGVKKNECIRELVHFFGSMVKTVPMEYAIPDNRGRYKPEDLEYSKLLDSSKYVVRAKRALIKNENFDTRDFTIFIAKKNWTRTILRPLLELCAKDDSLLAMRCCGLALVLIKRLSDKAMKYLVKDTKKKPRRGGANSTEEKGGEGEGGSDKEGRDSEDEQLSKVTNAKQQLSALLSFKEALCSEKCNEALTNCFKEFWEKEQEATNEDNKQGVAICFSYFRRILAIEANPLWSTPGELAINKSVHNKYIIQLRQIMGVIPGVCSDILRSYHNDWLADIILILFYAMNNFDSKDLFTVWKSGSLIENFEDILDENDDDKPDTQAADPVKTEKKETKPKELMPIVVPALLKSSNTDPALKKGSLLGMLKKEKSNRDIAAASSISSDPSRFRGVYRQPLGKQGATVPLSQPQQTTAAAPVTGGRAFVGASGTVYGSTSVAAPAGSPPAIAPAATTAAPPSPTAGAQRGATQTARIVKNPFSLAEQVKVSQAKVKNGKKNLAFMDTTGKDNVTVHSNRLTDVDSQRACVVVATLVNLVSNEISLKPLIKRVNEDLRRDEMRVTHDLESRYFEIIAKILNYNRLKLADQYKSFLDRSAAAKTEPAEVWEPNLKNVMDALDRMSFSRVIGSIERNNKQGGKPEEIAIPMNLYKEMICYMRVLLESGLEGHHEIAVASLFRLFYTASNEKMDPLQKLLSSWKPNTFPKRHMNVLVELVHETLKTLEAAQNRYKDNELAAGLKKKQRPKGRREMDLEQYIIACISFDVNDYFKRLVQNNTIRMYTTLLANYSRNETNVNHYIFCFFQRMCNYKLEQQWKAPPPPLPVSPDTAATTTPVNNLVSVLNSGSLPYEDVHLGFMLFNIQTLLVFSIILNDPEIYCSPSYKYMEPLVRLIKSLVRRFGEASRKNRMMFVEALFHQPRPMEFCCQLDSVYEAPSYNVRDTNQWKSGGGRGGARRGGDSSEDSADSSEDDDYGDEFDENNLTEQFTKDDSATAARAAAKKNKEEKRAARRAEKQKLRELKLLRKKQKKESRYGWSAEEDAVLKEQYALFAGTDKVFASIANSAEMRAIGKNRNANHIMKRARELNLHMQFDVVSDEEEEEQQSDASSASDGDKNDSDDEENKEVDEEGILRSTVKSQPRKRAMNPEDLNKSVDFGNSDDETETAGVNRLAGDGTGSDMDLEVDQQQEEGRVDVRSPSARSGAITTPETNSSSSGSARKKPRLAPKSNVDNTLGRAAWDNDDDNEDFIEKRRNALLKSRKETDAAISAGGGGVSGAKKLTAHKKKNALKSKISDDEDDKLFADSEVDDLPITQASVAASSEVGGSKLKKNVNRTMMIDSDDDEL